MEKVAREQIKKLKKRKGIKGIALSGSIVHKNIREDSDIDIVCFFDNPEKKKICEFWKDKSGITIHIIKEDISQSEKDIIPRILLNPMEWRGMKDHYKNLKPVWDPECKIKKISRIFSKIYPEERIYILTKYLFYSAWNISAVSNKKCADRLITEYTLISSIMLLVDALYLINNRLPTVDRSVQESHNIKSLKKKPEEIALIFESIEKGENINPNLVESAVEKTISISKEIIKKIAIDNKIELPQKNFNRSWSIKIIQAIHQSIEQDLIRAASHNLGIIQLASLRKAGILYKYYQIIEQSSNLSELMNKERGFSKKIRLLEQIYKILDLCGGNLSELIDKERGFSKKIRLLEQVCKLLDLCIKKKLRNKTEILSEIQNVQNKKRDIIINFITQLPNSISIRGIEAFYYRLHKYRKVIKNLSHDQMRIIYNTINGVIFVAVPNLLRKTQEGKLRKKILRIEKLIYSELRMLTSDKKCGFRKATGLDKARIESVKLSSSGTQKFKTNAPFIAEINYNAREKIKYPMFGIAIHSEDGAYLFGQNTISSGMIIPEIKGKGKIKFVIDKSPLLTGKYFFSATLMDKNGKRFFDCRLKEWPFFVLKGNAGEEYGLLSYPHHWEC